MVTGIRLHGLKLRHKERSREHDIARRCETQQHITIGNLISGFSITNRRLNDIAKVEHVLHKSVDAIAATVHLLADQDEPDLIELRGDARVTGGTGLGSLRALSARDINLDYGDDGRTLQRATLAGQAAMQLAAQDGSLGQRLSAEWMDVTGDRVAELHLGVGDGVPA